MNTNLTNIISTLPKGVDPASVIYTFIHNALIPPKPKGIIIELWIIFAGTATILVLSIIGLTMRYRRGAMWLFARTSDGTIRPNAAVTTQICFMLYSAFHLIVLPTVFLTNSIPSNAAFIWNMISFSPLFFAFVFITWSTILSSSTSSSFLRVNTKRPTSPSTSSRIIGYLAILAAILFQFSLIYPAYHTSTIRKAWIEAGWNLMISVGIVEKSGTGILGLIALRPSFALFIDKSIQLSKWYRISVAMYCGWTLLWVLLYVPSAIRLILTLRHHRQQFLRSINSLKVLDELVTNDDMELSRISSHHLHHASSKSLSPPPSPKSPRKPRLSHQLSQHPLVLNKQLGYNPSRSNEFLDSSSSNISITSTTTNSNSFLSPNYITTPDSSPSKYSSNSYLTSQDNHFDTTSKPLPVYQQRTTSSSKSDSGSPKESNEFINSESESSVIEKKRIRRLPPPALTFPTIESRNERNSNAKIEALAIKTSRSQERLTELQSTLSKTNRLLATIIIQFIFASIMITSYSLFGLVVLFQKISRPRLSFVYISWLGWTFVGPALLGTVLFTYMSFSGSRSSLTPPSPKHFPNNHHGKEIGNNEEEFDFEPTLPITFRNQNDHNNQINFNSIVEKNKINKINHRLTKATSFFSLNSIKFISSTTSRTSSLDLASINRKGKLEESVLDNDSDLGELNFGTSSNSNTTSTSTSKLEGNNNNIISRSNTLHSNLSGNENNQRWKPSDWSREK